MKYFFALGAIASLCQSACALDNGPHTIAPTSRDNVVLTVQAPNGPLTFEHFEEKPGQIWTLNQVAGGYFEIHNDFGQFINCQQQAPRTCYTGDNPQSFLPEFQGDTNYELVEQGSGLFLRLANDGTLQLAKWDQSIDEQFSLKRLQ
ncbi:hypothetical protein N7452_006245 [Penicillium brevicompactum]|uniref:Uncharacterized protein n=1 Tax=Penicillium brevicompactum TaxID=5074 RepID=A0A9W9UFX5_PENBR|nr:hypothetical protein N7452_006245 [Penicillium brevicompactum]